MIVIKNLRIREENGWCKLVVDIDCQDTNITLPEKEMWIGIEKKNEYMLTEEVYDPFVLVPLGLAVYFGEDLKIEGCISPKFEYNIRHYLLNIIARFLKKPMVNLYIDGVRLIEGKQGKIVGTGISCGVDSFVTLYDNYYLEKNSDYRINGLFLVNSGTHGDFSDPSTRKIWLDRADLNVKAAEDLELPMYLIDSNIHAFSHILSNQHLVYLAIYSCILACQKEVKRYYTSSNYSYDEILKFGDLSRDFDYAEYAESWATHLVATDRFELIIDGCQYTRGEKLERIANWKFAQDHLNVCLTPINGAHNCSHCRKCNWTLFPIEAIGKLDDFSNVFDIKEYKKRAFVNKCRFVLQYGKSGMETSVVDFVKARGGYMPSKVTAYLVGIVDKIRNTIIKR